MQERVRLPLAKVLLVVVIFVAGVLSDGEAAGSEEVRVGTIRVGPYKLPPRNADGTPAVFSSNFFETPPMKLPADIGDLVVLKLCVNKTIVDGNGVVVPQSDVWIHHFTMDLPYNLCGIGEGYQVAERILPPDYRVIFKRNEISMLSVAMMALNSLETPIDIYFQATMHYSIAPPKDVKRVYPGSLFHKHASVLPGGSPNGLLVFRSPFQATFDMEVFFSLIHAHQGFVNSTIYQVTKPGDDENGLVPICTSHGRYYDRPCTLGDCGSQCEHTSPYYGRQMRDAPTDCDRYVFKRGSVYVAETVYSAECAQDDIMMCWKVMYRDMSEPPGYRGAPHRSMRYNLKKYWLNTPNSVEMMFDVSAFPSSRHFFIDLYKQYNRNPPGSTVRGATIPWDNRRWDRGTHGVDLSIPSRLSDDVFQAASGKSKESSITAFPYNVQKMSTYPWGLG
mmetsp:Transcript_14895/g.42378  ORF Transcript_14895/g.42378 Transcript_14895/m.42378 type:complete len:448 (+) Transcript_14895:101-1444(+)|eukprot:CAMPEP_0119148718 /NCGR_PEP_ID=MMETSP1310-20130426/42249_1 /TAXON_ID=464262 /ORGANISM="Genus nov. species nov., Strain RCC2339" /LENGTH=447 /DNA_ID=CAMNT_0007140769 /DNA_START=79 /DNA_END=1422 /DNA_ORIENTATION=-